MADFAKTFIARGGRIIREIRLETPPRNAPELVELLQKSHQVAPEQVVKAVVVQVSAPGTPEQALFLLLPAAERLDLKLLSRACAQTVAYYPQEQIEKTFGAALHDLSVLAAPEKRLGVAADGRVFENETVVIAGGAPLTYVEVGADELRAYLGGEAVRTLDLESARQSKAGLIEPRTLKGFRDYLPDEMLPRQAMVRTISTVFERFGFAPLQTPALEYSDILLGKLGREAEKLLFRFHDHGGRDVCLRYDLTVPLARLSAQYADLPKPFKRYQVAPVWRAEKPGRGRFREFFQCDADIVGSASLLYDAECIALGFAVMQALGVAVEMRFSNRKLLSALGQALAVTEARQMLAIFRTIDKLPAQGRARVTELLQTDGGCTPAQIEKIMRFIEITGSTSEMLAQLSGLLGPGAAAAIGELRGVHAYAQELCPPPLPGSIAARLVLDLSIARGLDYYTGTVYETFLAGLPGYGSVMSGGRYDGLIELYSGKPTPAVGLSVGLDRLLAGLLELGRIPKRAAASQVMVVAFDAACVTAALRLLRDFRAAGVAAELGIDNERKPKLDRQLSLAGKKGIPFAAILGPDEISRGTLTLKDLQARRQEELTLAQAVAKVTRL